MHILEADTEHRQQGAGQEAVLASFCATAHISHYLTILNHKELTGEEFTWTQNVDESAGISVKVKGRFAKEMEFK